jgi:hypothetical protein
VNVWLYHINPKSPQNWEYGWDLARPGTLLRSSDKVWPTGNFFRKIKPGDSIAILMKNTGSELGDGVYIVGEVTEVFEDRREFVWRPDRARSTPLLDSPIPVALVREYFGRGFGSALQRLDESLQREWMRLISRQGEVRARSAVPRVAKRSARSRPR